MALPLIDFDRLKAINDPSGHGAGDAVLQAVARRRERSARQSVLVARLCGDEFTIVMGDIIAQSCRHGMVDRIFELPAEPVVLDVVAMDVGASIGVASHASDAPTVDARLAARIR